VLVSEDASRTPSKPQSGLCFSRRQLRGGRRENWVACYAIAEGICSSSDTNERWWTKRATADLVAPAQTAGGKLLESAVTG